MISLGVHSHFSFMRGAASMDEICRHARQLGYSTIALTDLGSLHGLWSFLAACEQEQITPILGAEIRTNRQQLYCLVKNKRGYRHLCGLLTRFHCRPDFDLFQELQELHQGMVCLAATPSLLSHCREIEADTAAALPGAPNRKNSEMRHAANQLQVPAVAVSDAFFLRPSDYILHQLLRAIDTNSSLSRTSTNEFVPQNRYLAAPAEFQQRFSQWPEALKAIHQVAEKCTCRRPDFGLVMPPYAKNDAKGRLRHAAYEGARKRYGTPLPQAVVSRLEHELQVIGEMQFSSYFLVVRDIVGPVARTCGRGSGAASLVAYCLDITNVCPVKHNLYFERFLNPGRTDAPDIDVDFSWDERDSILSGVLQRFGCRAAMVSNHVLMQPRMAIRETAKVFGLPGAEISRVTKKLPWIWRTHHAQGEYMDYLSSLPRLRDETLADPWPRILHMAAQVAGAPKNLSVHPGGVIITPDPVDTYVPVEIAPKGVPIIQWEKDGAEEAGLVKIDLLGNRSLGVIRDAIQAVREQGIAFDEHTWEPEDDPATRRNLAKGNTMGCFYIESPATRLLQRKAGTGDFAHLVLHSSIIRPAANEYIREYLRRLHGDPWEPLHPLVGNVLNETYGIMVYQEDVSRVAVQFGFSHADADRLRKIMSKKDRHHRLEDFRGRFFQSAAEQGADQETIARIWDMMMSFSGYSFCKPHSASYAKVSFQAAYLKTHYPAEFMAAVISNQGGFYSTFAYVSEAHRLGLKIRPPDVNRSRIRWHGHGSSLRVGLMAVHGLSQTTLRAIVTKRNTGSYTTLLDFLQRVDPDKDEALALIHCGALDQLEPYAGRQQNRGVLCWILNSRLQQKQSPVPRLFFYGCTAPELPEQPPLERMRNEYRILGFLCHTHPITLFSDQRRRLRTIKAAELEHLPPDKRHIRFLGWLIAGKIVGTKQGEQMEFLSFEDETGQVECTFFPKVYRQYCHLLHNRGPLLLEGVIDEEFGVRTLTVHRAADRQTGFAFQPVLEKKHKRPQGSAAAYGQ